MKTLVPSLSLLALALTLVAPAARADVAPDPCETLNAGDACTLPDGSPGVCVDEGTFNICRPAEGAGGGGGAGGSGGTGGAGGSGGSTSSGGSSDDDSGCSVSAPSPVRPLTGAGMGLVLGFGALLLGRRRRRG
ncbi:MYXO-CTERM sorting domain-containing protein [Chondromyces apiculatus]|uniref:Uncharacterized protein n=1 Tax=Chondromyces apiculatus DSM 436 TaxID=1192034 RepID=A0A017T451_9BACT|nr:MYXO-CTERM sorting domain-containing protein [Chondromyces apiculatus]EYF03356.1 Hypothetical protein CAP_5688 [Chondromyces apiculatus DSM 436]